METGSKALSLNKTDMKKVGKGLLIAISGAVLTYMAEISTQIDFGDYSLFIGALLSTAVNLGMKFLQDKSKKQ